ncbi:unnamed protein product [Urochloa humidicola]
MPAVPISCVGALIRRRGREGLLPHGRGRAGAGAANRRRRQWRESCPGVILLSVRIITYLCDAMPRAADAVVRHGILPFALLPAPRHRVPRLLRLEKSQGRNGGYRIVARLSLTTRRHQPTSQVSRADGMWCGKKRPNFPLLCCFVFVSLLSVDSLLLYSLCYLATARGSCEQSCIRMDVHEKLMSTSFVHFLCREQLTPAEPARRRQQTDWEGDTASTAAHTAGSSCS